MYKKEKKVWGTLGKIGKTMFFVAGGACIVSSILSLGTFALALGCTSLTGLVLKAGSNYILETISFCENQELNKVVIPEEMKCNGSNNANEDMKNVKIYTVSPKDMGINSMNLENDSTSELQEFVSNPSNGPVLRRKMY